MQHCAVINIVIHKQQIGFGCHFVTFILPCWSVSISINFLNRFKRRGRRRRRQRMNVLIWRSCQRVHSLLYYNDRESKSMKCFRRLAHLEGLLNFPGYVSRVMKILNTGEVGQRIAMYREIVVFDIKRSVFNDLENGQNFSCIYETFVGESLLIWFSL